MATPYMFRRVICKFVTNTYGSQDSYRSEYISKYILESLPVDYVQSSLKADSQLLKALFYLHQYKAFLKVKKNAFYSKSFSYLRYLIFCPDFFDHAEKRLDKKSDSNFKIYDVTDWATTNYNAYIFLYRKK